MGADDDELERLRAERRALIGSYGNRGQRHPMGRMIGGLNPAAMRLHVLRGEISRREGAKRATKPPKPTLRPIPGVRLKGSYGLKYNVSLGGREGKIGNDNFGKWYVVVGQDVVADGLHSPAKARDAFAKFIREA